MKSKTEIQAHRQQALCQLISEALRKKWAKHEKTYMRSRVAQECGVSVHSIDSVLYGRRLPSLDVFMVLCERLDIDPGELLGYTSNKKIRERRRVAIATQLMEDIPALINGYKRDFCDPDAVDDKPPYSRMMLRELGRVEAKLGRKLKGRESVESKPLPPDPDLPLKKLKSNNLLEEL